MEGRGFGVATYRENHAKVMERRGISILQGIKRYQSFFILPCVVAEDTRSEAQGMRLGIPLDCRQRLLAKFGIAAAQEKPDPGFCAALRVVVKAIETRPRLQTVDLLKSDPFVALMRTNAGARIGAVPAALDQRRVDVSDWVRPAEAKPQVVIFCMC